MALDVGSRLGVFEVTGRLGEGGMGVVYRATDTTLDRDVALKVLPDAFVNDAERLARFQREAKVLASLNHPNIAAIHGLEQSGDVRALVLELVEGPTLQDRIAQGPIPLDEALPIAKQIAEGLEAAHEQGIIHRDLKPANVKVKDDGTVKVLDFGLAKALQPDLSDTEAANSPTMTMTAAATKMGVIMGTAAYMSPEQARGKQVDKRADIWAFGVVLYEMLTGTHVFAGEDVSLTLSQVLQSNPDWSALPERLPSGVDSYLRRCLEKDPKQRIRDIGDVRLALEGAFETSEADTLAATPMHPGKRSSGVGHLIPWAIAAAAIVVAIVQTIPTSSVDSGARMTRFSVPLDDSYADGFPYIAIAPDGSRVVYGDGLTTLYTRELDQFDATPLPGTACARSPFFSPDGQSVGFFLDGELMSLSVRGGDPLPLGAVSAAVGAAWGDDGMILFSPKWAGPLWQIPAAGGEPLQLTTLDRERGESGHIWPELLPDGRRALFTIFGGAGLSDAQVAMLQLDTGDYEPLFDGAAARYAPTGHLVYYRGGAYHAVLFDLAQGQRTGPDVPILPDVGNLSPQGAEEAYFAFSKTGTLVSFAGVEPVRQRLGRLAWVSRDGDVELLPFEPARFGDLSLSPDRRVLAVSRRDAGSQQLWIYDLDRGTAAQLTRTGYNADPIWHAGGEKIAFLSLTRGSFDIRWSALDGSVVDQDLLSTEQDEFPTGWSADDQLLFVRYSADGNRDLWAMEADDPDSARPLVETPLDDVGLLSPDGRWVAYRSGPTLYVAAYPGLTGRVPVASEVLDSSGHQNGSNWSPGSSELFFRTAQGLHVVSYRVESGTFTPGQAALVLSSSDLGLEWDVSADAERFLTALPLDDEAEIRIDIVQNWFEELQARVPTGR